jgi:hypothetical protein
MERYSSEADHGSRQELTWPFQKLNIRAEQMFLQFVARRRDMSRSRLCASIPVSIPASTRH